MPASNLRVTNKLTGEVYPYVVSWQIASNYFTAADGFSVKLLGVSRADVLGRPIELELDVGSGWRPFLVGRVDRVRSGDADGSITISGRDYIGDITETHLNPDFAIKEGETPNAILLRALAPMAIKTITGPEGMWYARNLKTSGKRGKGKRFSDVQASAFKADDPLFAELKPKKGMGLYEFCDRFAARFGYTIQPTTDRTVLALSRPDYDQAPSYKLQRKRNLDAGNNVVSGTCECDVTALPTTLQIAAKRGAFKKTVEGIGKPMDVVAAISRINKSLENDVGDVLSTEPTTDGLKLYRYRYQEENEAKTADQLAFVTNRKMGDFLKDAMTYQATVDGFTYFDNNLVWTPDTVVDVYDEVAQVIEPMWIEGVEYSWDSKSGAKTSITCWRLGAAIVGDPPPEPKAQQAKKPEADTTMLWQTRNDVTNEEWKGPEQRDANGFGTGYASNRIDTFVQPDVLGDTSAYKLKL